MDPRKLFSDDRYSSLCVFCGATGTTREHVASLVLLDDPLPDDLPVVWSCRKCNHGFSPDEEYLACLIDCVVSGSTDPAKVHREKVSATLRHTPALSARIAAGRMEDAACNVVWRPDENRVRSVVMKLARGHAAHQYGEPRLDEPARVAAVALRTMSAEQREAFEEVPPSQEWPEIGSRAFMNALAMETDIHSAVGAWTRLQHGRYRYMVSQLDHTVVRIVLSEYLACEVTWQ